MTKSKTQSKTSKAKKPASSKKAAQNTHLENIKDCVKELNSSVVEYQGAVEELQVTYWTLMEALTNAGIPREAVSVLVPDVDGKVNDCLYGVEEADLLKVVAEHLSPRKA